MKNLDVIQMENVQGGMPCWLAATLLVGSGIALCASGVGAVVGWVVFNLGMTAGAAWGYVESCFPELMDE